MHDLTLDVRSGATVDALLGALVELGASVSGIERDVGALGPGPVPITVRHARGGTTVRLHAPPGTVADLRWGRLRPWLARLAVDWSVRATAGQVLGRLAQARAEVHHEPLDEVEADHLGGLDELAGAVALGSALRSLGVARVAATAVGVGTGTMMTLEGEVALPGPVVDRLLADRERVALPVAAEVVDPVGAAFIAAVTAVAPDAGVPRMVSVRGRGAVRTRHGGAGVVTASVG